MAKGIPVVISPNGMPITPVQSGAPLLTVSGSGFGVPVTIAENAAPFVVDGLNPFDPSQLNPEVWYDPSDLSTVFQNATGTIPALPGDPAGLVLDARKELGPERRGEGSIVQIGEQVTPPLYNSATGKGVISRGSSFGNGSALDFTNIGTPIQFFYFDIENEGETELTIRTSQAGNIAGTILYTVLPGARWSGYVYGQSSYRIAAPENNTVVAFSVHSIREILNPPLSQPTAAARPTLMQDGENYYIQPDLTDDALTTTFPATIAGDILIAGRNGSIIEPFSGNTLTIGPTSYTGGTPGILSAIGGIVGVLVIDRSLTQFEKDQLIAYYKGKGAGELL